MAKVKSGLKVLNQVITDRHSLYEGDSVEVIKGLPNNSIGLTVTSPPFGAVYQYSDSDRDMGNVISNEHFLAHFDYLIPELFRVTTPGRLCVMHCKDLPLFMGSDGVAGLEDFPGMLIRRMCGSAIEELTTRLNALDEARILCGGAVPEGLLDRITDVERELVKVQKNNWVYHSRVTIWKCPKTEMERTNNHGLLHSQLCKDSSVSRQGMADFLVVFRKWSEDMIGQKLTSIKPVTRQRDGFKHRFTEYDGTEYVPDIQRKDPRDFSIRVWQKYADPVWDDIKQTDVLNKRLKKSKVTHQCPLQLSVIQRCVELWSNPGDVVLDPFSGIGSTGWQSVKMGRNYVGIELNSNYFPISTRFLAEAANLEQLELVG